jgi:hypothetical protein
MYEATMRAVRRHIWWAGLGAALLSGCGGGGGDDPVAREEAQSRPSYSVGGTITLDVPLASGAQDSITLYLFDTATSFYVEPFSFTGSGRSFNFNRQLVRGDTYNVSVAAQAGTYTCSVSGGASGTIVRSDVTDVVVSCVKNLLYDVSVSVSGLKSGNSVVIRNNDFSQLPSFSNEITATVDGTYKFPIQQPANAGYSVSIYTQTKGANCTVVPPVFGVVTAGMSPIEVQCGVK